jgi:hypothetical protein
MYVVSAVRSCCCIKPVNGRRTVNGKHIGHDSIEAQQFNISCMHTSLYATKALSEWMDIFSMECN